MTAAADLIRATVNNRVDNEVRGASVATHRHRRLDRSRVVLPAVVYRAANSRSVPATPPSLGGLCGGLPGGRGSATCSRRDGEVGKSGLEALRAPSPWIRHWRTGQLVTGTIQAILRIIQGEGVIVSTIAGRPDFPRRRTGSRRQARPVSRRYEYLENALAGKVNVGHRSAAGDAFFPRRLGACGHPCASALTRKSAAFPRRRAAVSDANVARK